MTPSSNPVGGVDVYVFAPWLGPVIDRDSLDAVLIKYRPGLCAADTNGDGVRDVADIFAFLALWFAQDPGADFDANGVIAVPDIFAFLSAWFGPCP